MKLTPELKKDINKWTIRWLIGAALVMYIGYNYPEYRMVYWAAPLVALVSLAVIVGMHAWIQGKDK